MDEENHSEQVIEIFNRSTGYRLSDEDSRRLIRSYWPELKRHGDALYADEHSETKVFSRAVRQLAQLSVDGIENVLSGHANRDVIDSCKLVARAMIEVSPRGTR